VWKKRENKVKPGYFPGLRADKIDHLKFLSRVYLSLTCRGRAKKKNLLRAGVSRKRSWSSS
jgi:hypothetical protein